MRSRNARSTTSSSKPPRGKSSPNPKFKDGTLDEQNYPRTSSKDTTYDDDGVSRRSTQAYFVKGEEEPLRDFEVNETVGSMPSRSPQFSDTVVDGSGGDRFIDTKRPKDGNHLALSSRLDFASTIPNQFPDQAPENWSLPYRPPPSTLTQYGAAAEFYGDQGESVQHQPGVRPVTPVVSGSEAHLMAALATSNPPLETGQGSAAEFFGVATTDQSSFHAGKPEQLHHSNELPSTRPDKSSEPLPQHGYTSLIAGGVTGISAATLAYQHHVQDHEGQGNTPDDVVGLTPRPLNSARPLSIYAAGSSDHYQRQHRHRGPISRFMDWWNDYDDVRKMEDYTEYIGVCRYCFDPKSSGSNAPRTHNPHALASKEYQNHTRINKKKRYSRPSCSSSSSSRARRRSRSSSLSRLAIGTAGAGVALVDVGAENLTDQSTEVLPGQPYRRISARRGAWGEKHSHRGRQSSASSTSSFSDSRFGFFGKLFSPRSKRRRRKPSPLGAVYKSTRSARSATSDLDYESQDPSHGIANGARRRSSPVTAQQAVLGLGTAAALLTAARSMRQRSPHRHSQLFAVREQRKQRPKSHRRSAKDLTTKTKYVSSDDLWEDASESESFFSAGSDLAFGDKSGRLHRNSSLASPTSTKVERGWKPGEEPGSLIEQSPHHHPKAAFVDVNQPLQLVEPVQIPEPAAARSDDSSIVFGQVLTTPLHQPQPVTPLRAPNYDGIGNFPCKSSSPGPTLESTSSPPVSQSQESHRDAPLIAHRWSNIIQSFRAEEPTSTSVESYSRRKMKEVAATENNNYGGDSSSDITKPATVAAEVLADTSSTSKRRSSSPHGELGPNVENQQPLNDRSDVDMPRSKFESVEQHRMRTSEQPPTMPVLELQTSNEELESTTQADPAHGHGTLRNPFTNPGNERTNVQQPEMWDSLIESAALKGKESTPLVQHEIREAGKSRGSRDPIYDDDIFNPDFFKKSRSDSPPSKATAITAASVLAEFEERYRAQPQSGADFFGSSEFLASIETPTAMKDFHDDDPIFDDRLGLHHSTPPYNALIPRLNVIAPTPPSSYAGSVRDVQSRAASPLSSSVDEATAAGPAGQKDGRKTVTWDDPKVNIYHGETHDEHFDANRVNSLPHGTSREAMAAAKSTTASNTEYSNKVAHVEAIYPSPNVASASVEGQATGGQESAALTMAGSNVGELPSPDIFASASMPGSFFHGEHIAESINTAASDVPSLEFHLNMTGENVTPSPSGPAANVSNDRPATLLEGLKVRNTKDAMMVEIKPEPPAGEETTEHSLGMVPYSYSEGSRDVLAAEGLETRQAAIDEHGTTYAVGESAGEDRAVPDLHASPRPLPPLDDEKYSSSGSRRADSNEGRSGGFYDAFRRYVSTDQTNLQNSRGETSTNEGNNRAGSPKKLKKSKRAKKSKHRSVVADKFDAESVQTTSPSSESKPNDMGKSPTPLHVSDTVLGTESLEIESRRIVNEEHSTKSKVRAEQIDIFQDSLVNSASDREILSPTLNTTREDGVKERERIDESELLVSMPTQLLLNSSLDSLQILEDQLTGVFDQHRSMNETYSFPHSYDAIPEMVRLPDSRPESPYEFEDQRPATPQDLTLNAETTSPPSPQTSKTAIPLRFRAPPQSPTATRELPSSLTEQVLQPSSSSPTAVKHAGPARSRTNRPSSVEFKPSNEFWPLYLVETNSKKREMDPEEMFPSLPSSRTSSVLGTEENSESAAQNLHGSPLERVEDRETRDSYGGDIHEGRYLDSQQPTPRAAAFSELLQDVPQLALDSVAARESSWQVGISNPSVPQAALRDTGHPSAIGTDAMTESAIDRKGTASMDEGNKPATILGSDVMLVLEDSNEDRQSDTIGDDCTSQFPGAIAPNEAVDLTGVWSPRKSRRQDEKPRSKQNRPIPLRDLEALSNESDSGHNPFKAVVHDNARSQRDVSPASKLSPEETAANANFTRDLQKTVSVTNNVLTPSTAKFSNVSELLQSAAGSETGGDVAEQLKFTRMTTEPLIQAANDASIVSPQQLSVVAADDGYAPQRFEDSIGENLGVDADTLDSGPDITDETSLRVAKNVQTAMLDAAAIDKPLTHVLPHDIPFANDSVMQDDIKIAQSLEGTRSKATSSELNRSSHASSDGEREHQEEPSLLGPSYETEDYSNTNPASLETATLPHPLQYDADDRVNFEDEENSKDADILVAHNDSAFILTEMEEKDESHDVPISSPAIVKDTSNIDTLEDHRTVEPLADDGPLVQPSVNDVVVLSKAERKKARKKRKKEKQLGKETFELGNPPRDGEEKKDFGDHDALALKPASSKITEATSKSTLDTTLKRDELEDGSEIPGSSDFGQVPLQRQSQSTERFAIPSYGSTLGLMDETYAAPKWQPSMHRGMQSLDGEPCIDMIASRSDVHTQIISGEDALPQQCVQSASEVEASTYQAAARKVFGPNDELMPGIPPQALSDGDVSRANDNLENVIAADPAPHSDSESGGDSSAAEEWSDRNLKLKSSGKNKRKKKLLSRRNSIDREVGPDSTAPQDTHQLYFGGSSDVDYQTYKPCQTMPPFDLRDDTVENEGNKIRRKPNSKSKKKKTRNKGPEKSNDDGFGGTITTASAGMANQLDSTLSIELDEPETTSVEVQTEKPKNLHRNESPRAMESVDRPTQYSLNDVPNPLPVQQSFQEVDDDGGIVTGVNASTEGQQCGPHISHSSRSQSPSEVWGATAEQSGKERDLSYATGGSFAVDFAATLAAGLEDAGFNPDLAMHTSTSQIALSPTPIEAPGTGADGSAQQQLLLPGQYNPSWSFNLAKASGETSERPDFLATESDPVSQDPEAQIIRRSLYDQTPQGGGEGVDNEFEEILAQGIGDAGFALNTTIDASSQAKSRGEVPSHTSVASDLAMQQSETEEHRTVESKAASCAPTIVTQVTNRDSGYQGSLSATPVTRTSGFDISEKHQSSGRDEEKVPLSKGLDTTEIEPNSVESTSKIRTSVLFLGTLSPENDYVYQESTEVKHDAATQAQESYPSAAFPKQERDINPDDVDISHAHAARFPEDLELHSVEKSDIPLLNTAKQDLGQKIITAEPADLPGEPVNGQVMSTGPQFTTPARDTRISTPHGSENANTRRRYSHSVSDSLEAMERARSSSALSTRSRTAESSVSHRSTTSIIHRSNPSSDLGTDYKRGLAHEHELPNPTSGVSDGRARAQPINYDPLKGSGKDRCNIFDQVVPVNLPTASRSLAKGQMASQEVREGGMETSRSPNRSHSVQQSPSQQMIDLERRVEPATEESGSMIQSRGLNPDAETSQSNWAEALRARDEQLREKNEEIQGIRRSLITLQQGAKILSEENAQLQSSQSRNSRPILHSGNPAEREAPGADFDSIRKLEVGAQVRGTPRSELEGFSTKDISAALAEKDAEIMSLQVELAQASDKIRKLQQQIIASKRNDTFLNKKDEEFFESACQQLCQHVQQWVLRFSKFSDMRHCRSVSELHNEDIENRLDNAILDGTDVDTYLADRVKRRDVFMSVVMTLIWEFVFTRYLFGMDREQRQKLKNLEKILTEVGPQRAVAQWRATTLTLLSRRKTFEPQREQDTEAVVQEVYATLAAILPPPHNLVAQVQDSLRNVMRLAVRLSIDMRTQLAEYMMLPPLRPEYDENGDLTKKVYFNAGLMNEHSGWIGSNDDLERKQATVRLVMFPLVVKKGDDNGDGDEEIVIAPAQVRVSDAGSKELRRSSGRLISGNNHSTASLYAASSLSPGIMS